MRTLSWKRLVAAGLLAAAVPAAMLWVSVRACGPDWQPEVFVPANQPEKPALFADGELGILQPGYYHADLVVAYRVLSGGTLSDAEKTGYTQGTRATGQDRGYGAGPADAWRVARAAALGVPANTLDYSSYIQQDRGFKTATDAGSVEVAFVLNCSDSAFETANDTLHQREDRWGAKSPEFAEWLRGQDAVFSNCNKAGIMPDPAKPVWPLLLRQDRAYQIAASKFYSGDYDGAIADFEAIGKDKASPWNAWGDYLAARAEVRKAASIAKPTAGYSAMANFDKTELAAARVRLLKVEKESQDAGIRSAAEAELGFVEVRLDPGKRLDQVAGALVGPKPDPQFVQDLADLDYLMDRGVTGDSDLARWIKEIQFSSPNPQVPSGVSPLKALSLWRLQRSLPWLVAAIAEAKSGDAAPELLTAAAAVKPDSPAYATVNYYRIGILLNSKKQAEARTVADTVIAGMGPETMASTRNAFLAERMPTAGNLAEFLADAPRTVIESGSSAASMEQCSGTVAANRCTLKIPPLQFDADAADELDNRMPLALWQQAAASTALPKNLRDAVAWAAWMRALGLEKSAQVKQMAALLPEAVHKTSGDSDGFPATLALLRNPGMRPYLQQGVQRSATYSAMDELRDNWWCGNWTDGGGKDGYWGNQQPAQTTIHAGFLTAQQQQEAKDEVARLNALPDGTVWLGQRAIAYVKAHPDDKDAAEALGLTVRATHYSCSGQAADPVQKAVSKDAFDLLHSKYPKSEWALKTKYYY